MNVSKSMLIAMLASVVLSVGCMERLELAAKEGANEAAGEKIDRSFKGGGVANKAAQAYSRNISFALKAARTNKNQVTLTGLVRNNGSKTVTYLKAHMSLQDKDGVEIGGRTDLLAHSYPFGDNNTPIPPGGAKRIICPIANKDWKSGKFTVSVIEIAIK